MGAGPLLLVTPIEQARQGDDTVLAGGSSKAAPWRGMAGQEEEMGS